MAISTGSRSAPARSAPGPARARKAALLRPQLPLPILKWAGGKSRLLDQLVAHVPTSFGRYFEPFVGGAALFFRLRPERATLSDLNSDLINVYRSVAFELDVVKRRLAIHQEKHSETYYYEMRTRWNTVGAITGVDRAAAFIYLNKTCYNGLWRVNSKGEFNVPVGRYEDPSILDPANLAAAGKVLARAELLVRPFADVADAAEAGDFVYFDPPYQPVSETARFVSYTASSFGEDDQRALADLVHGLVRRGVHVMVSNSDTPLIRDIYRGLIQHQVLCPRAINSRASARGPARELVIVGGPRPRL
jgi:DNA adenine methylase